MIERQIGGHRPWRY